MDPKALKARLRQFEAFNRWEEANPQFLPLDKAIGMAEEMYSFAKQNGTVPTRPPNIEGIRKMKEALACIKTA